MKVNDEVTPQRVLGEVAVQPGENSSVLHFEIWKSEKGKPTSENPTLWLHP